MSVYDRKERNTDLDLHRTAPIVGPGSYDIDRPNREKVRKDGYAPFNSLSTRNFTFGTEPETPAPGQYDPLQITPAKNVVTLKSTTARFQEKVSFTPGPGAYDVKELATMDHPEPNVKSRNGLSKGFAADKDVLVYKNIRFERKYNVPSIPVPSQSHGYEEGVNGTLVRQAPPEKDDTIGPAYYNAHLVGDTTPQSAAKYKGNHWGYMRSRRDGNTDNAKKAAKEIPGPGTYEIPDFTRSVTEPGQGVKQELRIPRFVEGIISEAKKRGGPGPGWYEVPGDFQPKPRGAVPLEEGAGPIDRPPFLSSESRFKGSGRQLLPGPGTYSDPRTALESLRKPTALKRQPFGQTAARFGQSHSAGTPGPAAYYPVGELSRESLRKAFMAASQRGAFGTSSTRSFGPPVLRDAIEAPGPGHYDPKVHIAAAPRYVQMSSTFASTSKRDGSESVIDKAVPPPGSYDVSKAFHAVRDQKVVAKPRTDDAWRRQTSFGVAADRWRSESDINRVASLPGPGQYETDTKATAAIDPKRGRTIPHETRFRSGRPHKMPGPADYTLSPLLQDTVLRGTFNVSLGQAQLVK